MKRVLGVWCFVVLMVLVVSCEKRINQSQQSLLLNAGAEPSNLNPILSTDSASSVVEGFVFSGLFRVNEALELEADLVDSYVVNESGTVYTFHLKRNVFWHDGYPFTAEDVKFTFDKILDPSTNTVRRSGFVIGGQPVQFEVIDRYTIQAVLPKAFSPFLVNSMMNIIPKHLLENEDINRAAFNQNPVGTGPFVFKEWKASQYVQLVRNENYYGEMPKLEEIILKIIPDDHTAKIALEKGEIHQEGLLPKDFKAFQSKKQFNLFDYYALSYTYMGFNLKSPYFSDIRVRQAIAHAINKKNLVGQVLKGFGQPLDIPSSPVSWAYPDSKDIFRYEYDPQKSRVLLEQAGFSFNTQTHWFERGGKPLEFTLITNQGNERRKKSAEIIQQFLKAVGIQVNIRIMEWSSFVKILNNVTDPKPFDAVMLGWSLGLDPDGYSIWHSSQYPKGFNFVAYDNPQVDQYLDQGRTELSLHRRKEIYQHMYQLIAQDLPYLFLYNPLSLVASHKKVRGLSTPGPAGLLNRIEQVYLAP